MKHDDSPGGDALDVSHETLQRLHEFVDVLSRWSRTINLVADPNPATIWARHVADSLQLLPLMSGRPPPAADLGSGAGFPSLVLAIASGQPFHLIEADRRKAAFLREAVRVTGAPATVHAERIEAARLAPVEVVTARACAPLPRLLGYAERLLGPAGVLLCLKGRTAKDELTAARAEWQMQVISMPSRTDPAASILQISGIRRVR